MGGEPGGQPWRYSPDPRSLAQLRTVPPRAAIGWRTGAPEPSRRPSGGGSGTGVPASVAPRAGPGPAQASTSTSSPFRNLWQRTPPVARPLGGYSAYGVTFTVAAEAPGSAPALPATVTTTGELRGREPQ